MNQDRQYPLETLINKQYVEFLKDQWTKNEFVYKNGGLTTINIYELMYNPVEDKAYFEIIKLSDERYLEIYFPFIEIKHSIPIPYKREYEFKSHETTITKYIKCSKYTSCKKEEGDIVCSLISMGIDCLIYNTLKPNKAKNYATDEMVYNNSYKYSHSYYKAKYFEPHNAFESKVIISGDNTNFSVIVHNTLDDLTYTHSINNPITYVMGLEFDLYKDLTN
jgi:hypothetical protein